MENTFDLISSGDDRVILVACCGLKLPSSAPAGEIYISSLFKKSRAFAERNGTWFILSAKHGLASPSAVIEPYDATLKRMTSAERLAWGRKVALQIEDAELMGKQLIALAGLAYVEPLRRAGLTIEQPMAGLSIGRQLQWLNRENSQSLSPRTTPTTFVGDIERQTG